MRFFFPLWPDEDTRTGLSMVRDLPVFELTLCTTGFWVRPKIVRFGTEGTPPGMWALVGALTAVAGKCGIRLDERPLKPNITAFRTVRGIDLLSNGRCGKINESGDDFWGSPGEPVRV